MSLYRRTHLGASNTANTDLATPDWLAAAITAAGVGAPIGPVVAGAAAASSAATKSAKTAKPKEASKAARFNAPAASPITLEPQSTGVKRWLLIGGLGAGALGLVWFLFLRPTPRRLR